MTKILDSSWRWYWRKGKLPISKVKRAQELLRGDTKVGMMVDVGLKNSGAQNLFTKVMNAHYGCI